MTFFLFSSLSRVAIDAEQSNKRQASEKSEKLDYLIRDALDRECPPVIKRDGNIFKSIMMKREGKKKTFVDIYFRNSYIFKFSLETISVGEQTKENFVTLMLLLSSLSLV